MWMHRGCVPSSLGYLVFKKDMLCNFYHPGFRGEGEYLPSDPGEFIRPYLPSEIPHIEGISANRRFDELPFEL